MTDTTPDTRFTFSLASHHEAMVQAFVDALDTMGFLFADPAEEVPEIPIEPIRVAMKFAGTADPELVGTFELNTSRTFARTLASNVLGCDVNEINDDAIDDCVKELVNVAVGAFTPILSEDPDEKFTLTPPALSKLDALNWSELLNDASVIPLVSDGEPLVVRILSQ